MYVALFFTNNQDSEKFAFIFNKSCIYSLLSSVDQWFSNLLQCGRTFLVLQMVSGVPYIWSPWLICKKTGVHQNKTKGQQPGLEERGDVSFDVDTEREAKLNYFTNTEERPF